MARNKRASDGDSILSASTNIEGNVHGAGGLSILGTVTGNVDVDGPVELGAGSQVNGDVRAASLTIDGTLDGDATAVGLIAVGSGARVTGVLKGSGVSIEAGATVSVRLDTEFELAD
jgi:cytoskeletal protein CcmA (bactofilin family)